MNVYLDHDVICGICKNDMPTPESTALEKILVNFPSEKIDFWASRVHEMELSHYGDPIMKEQIEKFLYPLPKVQFVEDHEVRGFNNQWNWQGGISSPLIEDHSLAKALHKIGLKRRDAHHLMLAIMASCDIFLTCDKGILNRKQDLQNEFPSIRLMKPSEFVVEFTLVS